MVFLEQHGVSVLNFTKNMPDFNFILAYQRNKTLKGSARWWYKVVLLFLGFIQLDSTPTQAFTTVNTVHKFKKNCLKKICPPYPIVQTFVIPNQQLFVFGLMCVG